MRAGGTGCGAERCTERERTGRAGAAPRQPNPEQRHARRAGGSGLQAATAPIRQMEEVLAPDARTVVIRWRGLYPDAAGLGKDFQALPRHLLAQPFETLDAAGFTNLSYWTADYVGLGPYKLERWEPG